MKKNNKKMEIMVVNVMTKEIFSNMQIASKVSGINDGSISKCIRGKVMSAGTIDGKKVVWSKATKREIDAFKNSKLFTKGYAKLDEIDVPSTKKRTKKVICVDNGKIFKSICEANRYVGGDVYASLNNGKVYSKTGQKFMYYDDYATMESK